MRSLTLNFATILGLLVLVGPAQTSNHFPTPPEPLDTQAQKSEQAQTLPRQIDYEQVQKHADDLARLAQSIPPDVASMRKGVLPKDVIEKLKQIEKLSKRLRTELNP
jgi:hypothetical protein